jgi:hypothetical protein
LKLALDNHSEINKVHHLSEIPPLKFASPYLYISLLLIFFPPTFLSIQPTSFFLLSSCGFLISGSPQNNPINSKVACSALFGPMLLGSTQGTRLPTPPTPSFTFIFILFLLHARVSFLTLNFSPSFQAVLNSIGLRLRHMFIDISC